MAVPPNRALLIAEVPFSGRARVRALWYENYRFSASRAPGVGSANSITPRAKRASSMRLSFGADVGRLSCLRSQKRTARSSKRLGPDPCRGGGPCFLAVCKPSSLRGIVRALDGDYDR